MKTMKLSGAALVYAVTELGAEEIHGMEDPFLGMTEPEIADAAAQARLELDRSGYGEMKLDGGFQLSRDAEPLLDIAAVPDFFLQIRSGRKGGSVRGQVIYGKGGNLARLEEEAGCLRLEECSAEEALAGILRMTGPLDGTDGRSLNGQKEILLSAAEIRRAAEASARGDEPSADAILAASCGQQDMRRAVLDGLNGLADSMMAVYIGLRTNGKASSLAVIHSLSGAVLLETADASAETWSLSPAALSGIEEKLRLWLRSSGADKEAADEG